MAYLLGDKFPHEGFVQKALERHFAGWEFELGGPADLRCSDSDTGFVWVIEAKGMTANVNLDFKTGLGQLLGRMDGGGPGTFYALAMPDTDAFEAQRETISEWVRAALNLYWFLVDESGGVMSVPPNPAERV